MKMDARKALKKITDTITQMYLILSYLEVKNLVLLFLLLIQTTFLK